MPPGPSPAPSASPRPPGGASPAGSATLSSAQGAGARWQTTTGGVANKKETITVVVERLSPPVPGARAAGANGVARGEREGGEEL